MGKIVIKAAVLFDGKGKSENKYVVIEGEKIIDVTDKAGQYNYEGYITPGFVDAHSHIGMVREGEPWMEEETNDITDQLRPLHNPLNSIYMDDRAFKDSIDFGVLYSCIVPGSGNLLGGQAKVIRHFAQTVKEAFFKDYGYKMALGFNPRSTEDWKGIRPNTRMGIYAVLEKKFNEILIKKEKADLEKKKKLYELDKKKREDKENKITEKDYKFEKEIIEKEYEFNFTEEDKKYLELLEGKKIAKVHVHKEDDVIYLIDLVKKYGLVATADHTGDVFHKEIFDKLGEANIPVVYGPIGSLGYKTELMHAYYQNTKLLMESKAFYGLMTDHPVIYSYNLRDSLKYFMIYGLNDAEAISLITYKNAKILGIDNVVGTIEVGKLASLVVWDKHPLTFGAYPKLVLGEGKILRDNTI